jgi:hypothetical protein
MVTRPAGPARVDAETIGMATSSWGRRLRVMQVPV